LDEGIASLRIGNKEEARRKLMQIINTDERNEAAWLYLSEAVESDEDREICLENALTINPTNERAETELKSLKAKMAQGRAQAVEVICPTCGVANPPGSQRCFSCYSPLDQVSAAPPLGTAQPSAPCARARDVQHKSFMEMLDTWAEMLALPRQTRLDDEHAYARWGLTVPGILLASGVTYFFVLLTNAGTAMLMPGGAFELGRLLPIACGGAALGAVAGLLSFFISSGLYYFFARLLQGRGEFVVQSYLLSLVYGPYSLVVSIIFPLTLLSAVNPLLGFIPTLILLPISILAIIMTVRALKSAHGYGTGSAIGTLLLPGIVLGCICGPLFALLGGGALSSLTDINSLLLPTQ
jgi:hypothetical protein